MIIEKAKGNPVGSFREVAMQALRRGAAVVDARRLAQQEEQKRRNPHIDRAALCVFFPRGDGACSKGVSCRFKHDVSAESTRPTTRSETIVRMEEKVVRNKDKIVKLEQKLLKIDYLKRAQRSQLEANPSVGSAPSCRFFSTIGGCAKGDGCVFLHDIKDDVTALRAEINKLHHDIRYLETGIVKMHEKKLRRPVHKEEEDEGSYCDSREYGYFVVASYVVEGSGDVSDRRIAELEELQIKNEKEAREEERLKKLEDERIQREYEAACMAEMEGFGV